ARRADARLRGPETGRPPRPPGPPLVRRIPAPGAGCVTGDRGGATPPHPARRRADLSPRGEVIRMPLPLGRGRPVCRAGEGASLLPDRAPARVIPPTRTTTAADRFPRTSEQGAAEDQ